MNPNIERCGKIAETYPTAIEEDEGFLTKTIAVGGPKPFSLALSITRNSRSETTDIIFVTTIKLKDQADPVLRAVIENVYQMMFSDHQERVEFDFQTGTFRPSTKRSKAWADIFRYPKLRDVGSSDTLLLQLESYSLDEMDEHILRTTKHTP